jgi:hypothetical protein
LAAEALVVGSGGSAFPLRVDGALKDLIEAPSGEVFRSRDPRKLSEDALAPMGSPVPGADVVSD